MSLAQLTRRNHGKVIVQVDRLRSDFRRPRDVILPAALVDIVVVCPQDKNNEVFGTLSGEQKSMLDRVIGENLIP